MENHRHDSVLGNPDAPYETALAHACASASDYAAVGSPSLPNYLAATSGSTHGVHDDGLPSVHHFSADNLFRQVRAIGGTAISYEESMTAPCALRPAGRYAVKHNPAAYYSSAEDRAACTRDDLPLGSTTAGPLAAAVANGALPTFSFITPNLCDDTHNCGVQVGDGWLAAWVPRLLRSPQYRAGTTVVFVVWDEPSPMPFIAIAPSLTPNRVVMTRVDHYALLRTTEELLGIEAHLGSAASAPSLRPLLGL